MKSSLYRITTVALAAIFLSGCASPGNFSTQKKGLLTPITESPTGQYDPGRFVWHTLITPDARAAGEFYQKLFGWQLEYRDNYAVVRNDNHLIADILQIKPADQQGRRGIWLPSVSVSDVDGAATTAVDNGGKILKGPATLKNRGRAVLIRDPQQTDIILLKGEQGDPAKRKAAIGDWLWDELWTDQPQQLEAFYAAVAGYAHTSAADGYDIFTSDGKWRAGIRLVAEESTNKLWVPVVRVTDPQALVAQVEKFGGVVWVSPQETLRHDTALIADPTGALLLIQRWPVESAAMEQ